MKELSLHILDIAENSVRAGAKTIRVELLRKEAPAVLRFTDDGCGMTEEIVHQLSDPFFTTRTTRSIGLGIPLFRLAAEQTGGDLSVTSSVLPENHGTVTTARFYLDHIDCPPLGDLIGTLVTLIQGSPEIDFLFCDETPHGTVTLETGELRAVLGDDVPLSTPEVLSWIRENLAEQYADLENNKN